LCAEGRTSKSIPNTNGIHHSKFIIQNLEALLEGIKWGLSLSVLMGPLLFSLIQASIEQGFRAGIMVALGIWFSDILFIVFAYLGVSYILEFINWQGFEVTVGIAGGLILIGVGVGMFLSKPPSIDQIEIKGLRYDSYLSLFTKGFLINTVNPFTFTFWFIISAAIISKFENIKDAAALYYIGIFGTILLTDTLKVLLAKMIRPWLKPQKVFLMRRIAGAALVIFGIILMVRVTVL